MTKYYYYYLLGSTTIIDKQVETLSNQELGTRAIVAAPANYMPAHVQEATLKIESTKELTHKEIGVNFKKQWRKRKKEVNNG